MDDRARAGRAIGGTLIAVSLALGITAGAGIASHAAAFTIDPEQATPGLLTLWERRAPAPNDPASLSPGQPGYWLIRAEQDDPSGPAELSVRIGKRGPLAEHPRGLTVKIEQCLAPWAGVAEGTPACAAPGGSDVVTPAHDVAEEPSDAVYLLPLERHIPHHFLVTLSVDDAPATTADDTLQGLSAVVEVGLTASLDGERSTPSASGAASPGAHLPATGGDPAVVARLLGLALAAFGVGIGLRLVRSPRGRPQRRDQA